MDTVGTSRTAPTATRASSDAKRNIWSAKIIFVLLGLHNTLRNYGPPSVPHKTSEIATILKTVSSFVWAPYCYELLVTLWAAPAGSSVLRVEFHPWPAVRTIDYIIDTQTAVENGTTQHYNKRRRKSTT
ncbi:uncharacterized protein LOC117785112 [Drosophila innubila]|uniref:uncharacterized protein LOC117785112 n=1 Tax=Drosophila innubila TaxID=198719 RepID=UPI00148DA0CE|nr:uncharacterized protein LOC117785112 [Drosophila innubila]